jgi:pimeloyl-ACP methyl ester carboxylesterase
MRTHALTGGGGVQLAVHEYGISSGPAIVLIHGFSQSHHVWSKQFQSVLAQEFRLVCPDNRGHGMSEKPLGAEHYTEADRWAEDVQTILAGLALRRPVLVGWSYGGFIINDYLARYGQAHIGGINYVGAGVLLGVEKAANAYGRAFMDSVPGLCSDDPEENGRAARLFLRALFAAPPSPEEFETLLAACMAVPPAVRRALLSRSIDRDAILRAVTVPVLISQGAEDAVVLAAHTAHLQSCIPGARASFYAGVGHSPFFEDPSRFNRELAAFARQHAGW